MEGTALWLTPLLLLPGVGLLIVSSAARYGEVHAEVHRLLAEGTAQARDCAGHARRSAEHYCSALLALYVAAALLAVASLLGGLTQGWAGISGSIVAALSLAGVAAVAFAALRLVREALSMGRAMRAHLRQIEDGGD